MLALANLLKVSVERYLSPKARGNGCGCGQIVQAYNPSPARAKGCELQTRERAQPAPVQ